MNRAQIVPGQCCDARSEGYVASEHEAAAVDEQEPTAADGLRILTIAACPMPARRGTPVRIERLSEALVARGHAVTVATYHIGETMEASSLDLVRIGRPFVAGTLPPGPSLAKLFRFDPQLVATTRRLLARRSFDLIHAHHMEGLLVGALVRPRGMPLVYDAHTQLSSELPTYTRAAFQPLIRGIARRLDGLLPRLADHTVCAGGGVRDVLIERYGFPENGVSVAWNGAELEHFEAAVTARAAVRQPSRRVLYAGTLAGYQDIDLLLQAFARLHRTHSDIRLVLATDSPFDGLIERARALGIAAMIDVENNDFGALPAQLAAAAVAVVPRTQCDGVPQKLLNYMAACCPVVASRGSAALLEHEETGLIVENGDIDGFARAMRRIVDEPALAAALGRNAHAAVVRDLNWDTTAATVEGVYRELVPCSRAVEAV